MSEEKLALTNEQLGRLFGVVSLMRAENGEKEQEFKFDVITEPELEMFYGYLFNDAYSEKYPEKWLYYRSLVRSIHKVLDSQEKSLTQKENIAILYCAKRAYEKTGWFIR